jgi:hypothetical protein
VVGTVGVVASDEWSYAAQKGWPTEIRPIESALQIRVNGAVAKGEQLLSRRINGNVPRAELMAWVTQFGGLVAQIDPLGDIHSNSISGEWYKGQWLGGNNPKSQDEITTQFGQFLGTARSLCDGNAKVVTRRQPSPNEDDTVAAKPTRIEQVKASRWVKSFGTIAILTLLASVGLLLTGILSVAIVGLIVGVVGTAVAVLPLLRNP